MVEPLNALGLDAFVPGNWEPAYGPERFKDLMSRLKAPVVCYNFHDKASGERLFSPAVMLERGGVKVAFVGITDIKASERQPPVEFEGMDTTRIAGLREFVQQLRAKEKPDLVVAVMHTGLTISRQIAREIPEFDVILSGHTHERTEKADPRRERDHRRAGMDGLVPRAARSDAQAGRRRGGHAWQMIPGPRRGLPRRPAVKESGRRGPRAAPQAHETGSSRRRGRRSSATTCWKPPPTTSSPTRCARSPRPTSASPTGFASASRCSPGRDRGGPLEPAAAGHADEGRLGHGQRAARVPGERARTRLLEGADEALRRLGAAGVGHDDDLPRQGRAWKAAWSRSR